MLEKTMSMNPLASAWKSIGYLINGRLRFDSRRVGEEFVDERGQHFKVFRYVTLHPKTDQPGIPGSVFVPHFHVAGMSVKMNILFSLLPMWFIMGLPGFRSKCWMVDDESGDFSGYYEWDTLADAQNYAHSFAMRFMTDRSLPGSVWCNVYPAEQAPKPPARPDR